MFELVRKRSREKFSKVLKRTDKLFAIQGIVTTVYDSCGKEGRDPQSMFAMPDDSPKWGLFKECYPVRTFGYMGHRPVLVDSKGLYET